MLLFLLYTGTILYAYITQRILLLKRLERETLVLAQDVARPPEISRCPRRTWLRRISALDIHRC